MRILAKFFEASEEEIFYYIYSGRRNLFVIDLRHPQLVKDVKKNTKSYVFDYILKDMQDHILLSSITSFRKVHFPKTVGI